MYTCNCSELKYKSTTCMRYEAIASLRCNDNNYYLWPFPV